jgi:hypothetical protein
MNAMVGDAGEFTTQGFNTNNPAYQQFFALTEIPQPSDIFVFYRGTSGFTQRRLLPE